MMKERFLRQKMWWKRHTIQEQIFLAMLSFTIFSLVILGLIAYYTNKSSMEKNYQVSHETTLQNSSRVMDLVMQPIVDNSRSILQNKELGTLLGGKLEYNGIEFLLSDQRKLDTVLETVTRQEKSINSIALMDFYGHYYLMSNTSSGTYSFYYYYRDHDFKEEEWYEKTEAAQGREVFWGRGVLGGWDQDGIVCFTKILNDTSSGEPIGCLVVNLSREMFRNMIVKGDEGYKTSMYMIVDRDHGDWLVFSDSDSDEITDVLNAFTGKEENKNYVFSSTENSLTGWSMVNAVEKDELNVTSKSLRNIVIAWGVVLGALCFILAKFISRSITNPLKQLERTISSVGEGERNITEEFDDSEVGRIGNKFKEMVNTNLELSERLMASKLNEREAELLLLQSQINPHFLYNTLDSIYCLAIIHGDDQIAEMILALSENFKLSLNNGEKYMTVLDSIRRVEDYMKLQNIRYNDRFTLYVDAKRDVLSCRIISFILQPFVENAMYHGLEPKMGKGRICITARKEGTKIVIEISDDGVGVADMSRLENGYGIKNVRERIRLNYGENYGVTIKSEVGKGTTVRIVVPEKPGRI
ncbi:MAG TPA: sensor histidine kinase [Candidatus Mediterraneibacter norfolkensis]|nr:sensor histidine kinase [Candidatus Mediterraneibacter norfolkensis]